MYNLSYKRISKGCFLFIVMILFGYGFAYSQGSTSATDVSGVVVDEYGTPVTGVKISIKKSNYEAVTEEDGAFEFSFVKGITIVFSHPDYLEKAMKLGSSFNPYRTFKVSLTKNFLRNPKEMAIPYGSVNKDSYLGAASTVYTDQLTKPLAGTIIAPLYGQIAGLNISQNSGAKGHPTTVSSTWDIGGAYIPDNAAVGYTDNTQYNMSLRTKMPVIIVDGVQRELFSLDPEAIESVSAQKDALSTLNLGMRSSRGMLVVTTKEPNTKGFQLSFTGRYGLQESIKTPKPLSAYQYAYLLNEALQNDGKTPAYTYNDFEAYRNGSDPARHPDVNWYNQTMKENAAIQSYNLNVAGGGKVAQYFVSLGYFSEEGLFRTSSVNSYNTNLNTERYLITSKVNINITDDFKLGATLMGRIENGNQPGAGYGNIFDAIYKTPNNAYPVYNQNGTYGGNASFIQNLWAQTISSGYISDKSRDVLTSGYLAYDFGKLLKGLSARIDGSISSQSRSGILRVKKEMVFDYQIDDEGNDVYAPFGEKKSQSNAYAGVYNYQYLFGQFAVNYERTFGKHGVNATLLANQMQETMNYNLPEMPANLVARAKYNYGMKYFAEAAVNRAYYNGYTPGKQWGTFYAFGLGWDISKENFLSDAKWLNQLKIRGVYGKTGDGIDNTGYYTWRQSYSSTALGGYTQGTLRTMGMGVYENSPLANLNLTWEKANKLNIGTDIALFKNTLLLTADYYYDKYFDKLQARGKSIELIGLSYPAENIGKDLRQGLELSFTYQNHVGSLNYYLTANWSREWTELQYMDEQYVPYDYARRTGRPLGAIYGLVADGFFNSEEEIANSPVIAGYKIRPGDIRYKDLNGDEVIDEFDQKVIGGDKPLTYFGINYGFEYRGLEFSMLWQGVYNRDIYLGANQSSLMAGFQTIGQSYGQAYENILNRWTPETAATATYPRLTAGGNEYNLEPNKMWTSFLVKSGNYIRLKNITVAYNLPQSFCRNYLGGMKVKIFVGGDNLLTKAACTLVDPEVQDFRNYPMQKGFNTGINIKF